MKPQEKEKLIDMLKKMKESLVEEKKSIEQKIEEAKKGQKKLQKLIFGSILM